MIYTQLFRLATTVALALSLTGPVSAQDPFEPALRWRHAGDSTWIPRSVAFAARDNLVWSGASYGTRHLALLSGNSMLADEPLLFEDHAVAGAFPILEVAAGSGVDALYSIAQYPSPDPWHRRSEVTAHGFRSAAQGADFVPRWTHSPDVIGNGPALLDCDEKGASVAFAVSDPDQELILLDLLRGEDGQLLQRTVFPGASLRALRVSGDGSRIGVIGSAHLWIIDRQGELIGERELSADSKLLAFSNDGSTIAHGELGAMRVLTESPSGYETLHLIEGRQGEVPVKARLASDGRTLALAWWNPTSRVDVRLQVWDTEQALLLFEQHQQGATGDLQNLPAALELSPDGRRIAFGTWGNGTSAPEVILVDRDSAQAVLEIDLPGSVEALDIDASGTRIVVALKSTHANQVSTHGELRLYDTGERELQIIGQPTTGQNLELAFQRTDALSVIFLLGSRTPQPVPMAGLLGELGLFRSARLWSYPRPVSPEGRAGLQLFVPELPGLHGLQLAAQALYRRADGNLVFSEDLVDPLFR